MIGLLFLFALSYLAIAAIFLAFSASVLRERGFRYYRGLIGQSLLSLLPLSVLVYGHFDFHFRNDLLYYRELRLVRFVQLGILVLLSMWTFQVIMALRRGVSLFPFLVPIAALIGAWIWS